MLLFQTIMIIQLTQFTQNFISLPCHPQPKAKRFGLGIHPFLDSRFHGNDTFLSSSTESPLVILNRKRSASDWGSIPSWIPVFTGMTHSCHPQPKAKRFGLGIHPFLDSRFHGNDRVGAGMTGGTRITTDESSITIMNPTGQAPWYSLFCYLKWLHPCGKPQSTAILK